MPRGFREELRGHVKGHVNSPGIVHLSRGREGPTERGSVGRQLERFNMPVPGPTLTTRLDVDSGRPLVDLFVPDDERLDMNDVTPSGVWRNTCYAASFPSPSRSDTRWKPERPLGNRRAASMITSFASEVRPARTRSAA